MLLDNSACNYARLRIRGVSPQIYRADDGALLDKKVFESSRVDHSALNPARLIRINETNDRDPNAPHDGWLAYRRSAANASASGEAPPTRFSASTSGARSRD